MFPLFLEFPEKNILDQNGPYISMGQTKYTPVGDYGIPSVVPHVLSPYRSLIYLLKYSILFEIILTHPAFWFSRLFLGRTLSFTSKITVCLINIYNLVWLYAICDCRLWKNIISKCICCQNIASCLFRELFITR